VGLLQSSTSPALVELYQTFVCITHHHMHKSPIFYIIQNAEDVIWTNSCKFHFA